VSAEAGLRTAIEGVHDARRDAVAADYTGRDREINVGAIAGAEGCMRGVSLSLPLGTQKPTCQRMCHSGRDVPRWRMARAAHVVVRIVEATGAIVAGTSTCPRMCV